MHAGRRLSLRVEDTLTAEIKNIINMYVRISELESVTQMCMHARGSHERLNSISTLKTCSPPLQFQLFFFFFFSNKHECSRHYGIRLIWLKKKKKKKKNRYSKIVLAWPANMHECWDQLIFNFNFSNKHESSQYPPFLGLA
jgi:hypothetical protein